MSNEIRVFENEQFGKVRTVMIDGEPWFVGKDVATILGYRNISCDIRRHVDEEDFRNYRNDSSEMNNCGVQIVNESGLYALILGSKKICEKVRAALPEKHILGDIAVLTAFWDDVKTAKEAA